MEVRKVINRSHGFSLLELLTVLSISAIFASFSIPSITSFYGQLQASDDLRKFTYTLSELRSEAIRLKTNVRVSFNEGGYSWDINDDGSIDGTRSLFPASGWKDDAPPSTIVFNGLGVARGIGSEMAVTIQNRNTELSCQVNSNGYISV